MNESKSALQISLHQLLGMGALLVGFFITTYGVQIWDQYNEVIPLSINPEYTGFGVAHNFSRSFRAENFHLVHYVESPYLPSELRFYFQYTIQDNGTYMIAFLLPFKVNAQLTSDLDYNTTETGTIVWKKITHNNIRKGGLVSGWVEGHFRLGHTFIQGKRGQYVAILPYWVNLYGQSIADLQKINHLSSTSFDCRIKIDYLTILDYALMDSSPEFSISPRYNTWYQKPVIGVSWEFYSESQSIVLKFESPTEIDSYTQKVHWSGLLIGVGLPLTIQGAYDLLSDFIDLFITQSSINEIRVIITRIREKLSLKKNDLKEEKTEKQTSEEN